MITTIVIAIAGIIIGIVLAIIGDLGIGLGIIFFSLFAGIVVYVISKLKQKQTNGKNWKVDKNQETHYTETIESDKQTSLEEIDE